MTPSVCSRSGSFYHYCCYYIDDTYRHSGLPRNKCQNQVSNLTKATSPPLFSILNHYENTCLNLYQFLTYYIKKLNNPNILHPPQDPPIKLGKRDLIKKYLLLRAAYIMRTCYCYPLGILNFENS